MEPATQALAAITLSRAGLNKLSPRATLILLAATLAPDLDLLSIVGGAGTYLRCHRALLHSYIGGFILALALAAILTPAITRIKVPLKHEFEIRFTFFRVLALCL